MTHSQESYEEVKREFLLRETMKWSVALKSNAYALLRDWAMAEDAFQETLIVVNQKWEDFEDGRPVLPWARQILRLKTLELLRKQNRETAVADEALFNLIDSHFEAYLGQVQAKEWEHRKSILDSCIRKLNDQGRRLVLGFYRDGHDCETLGKLFSKSANAVRIILFRLRSELRNCVSANLSPS